MGTRGYTSTRGALLVAALASLAHAQAVRVELRAVGEASADTVNAPPESVLDACVGNALILEVWVTNLGVDPPGIAGGTVDLSFPVDATQAVSIDHGTILDVLTTGMLDPSTGIVHDLGGNTLVAGVAVEASWALLARVSVNAIAEGNATFTLSPGSLRFALAGGSVPLAFGTDVVLGPAQTLSIVALKQTGDLDCDADIDLLDLALLNPCVTGPSEPVDPIESDPVCVRADADSDNDVDLCDFAAYQNSFR